MNWIAVAVGGAFLLGQSASGQLFRKPKSEDVFLTPRDVLGQKLKRSLTEDDYNSYMWEFSRNTMASETALKENVRRSQITPFLSRRSVWADATIVPRAAEFGRGKYSREATERPTMADRAAASANPIANYPGRAEEESIMAAVYRHFFGYRNVGFAPDANVYFLGAGPHVIDVSPGLLTLLQQDPVLKKAGIRLRPMNQVLEVTNEALRDRETGGTGPAFRVDAIGLPQDGEVRVVATFSEREGFWFTREFTLRQAKGGYWEVVRDTDYPG